MKFLKTTQMQSHKSEDGNAPKRVKLEPGNAAVERVSVKMETEFVPVKSETKPVSVKLESGVKAASPVDSLDPKQREIMDLCLTGRNVFLTGVGGMWPS